MQTHEERSYTMDVAVTIRHGERVIRLPIKSGAEAIADLVKALNRHAQAERRVGGRGGAAIRAEIG